MKGQFTTEAEKAIDKAVKLAVKIQSSSVGTEHMLYGLSVAPGIASCVLKENGVEKEDIRFEIEQCVSENSNRPGAIKTAGNLSPRLEDLMVRSQEEADRYGVEKVGTEHILLSILKNTECQAYRVLQKMGANIQRIYMDIIVTIGGDESVAKSELSASRSKNKRRANTASVLQQYARDLTEYAAQDKLDPVLSRDDEISSVIEILSRRTKNNPCLIGEPGVGKTAVVEGLAVRIEQGQVPGNLLGKHVYTLDLSGMVAGSKYRGEFEERIKKAIREAQTMGNVLLFIDELHTVIGAGGAEGAIDASNILKPALARGEIQVIGATTRDEYRKHIEKDAALERRFQPIVVEEPTEAQAVSMLKGLAPKYEEFHKVKITNEAIEAAVRLSVRYINDRFLPDKAIDLIDEAAARYHLQQVAKKSDGIRKLESRRKELYESREQALIRGDMELVRSIREEELINDERIAEELKNAEQKNKRNSARIGETQIAEVVSKWTHIPVKKLQKKERERLQKLEETLHERVVGQKEAVEAVAKAVRRGRSGLKDPKRPIGSFLFLGPTGVGKTELTKALAEAVFGSEKDLIRVDMSEYMEKQSVSKMIGSPPGYVGYEEGGQLSEKVRRKPYSVILFDEIEKAHPDVFNMLLQVLDDGHITDAQGRRVDFKNTIIIMTSNAGAKRIISPKTLGFGQTVDAKEEHKRMKAGVMEEVKHIFKPEFINRIDEMIVFHTLDKENIREITGIMVQSFVKRVKEQMDIELSVAEEVVNHIANKGFDKDYGARPIRRALQTYLEDTLAEAVLSGDVSMGDEVEAVLFGEGKEKTVKMQLKK